MKSRRPNQGTRLGTLAFAVVFLVGAGRSGGAPGQAPAPGDGGPVIITQPSSQRVATNSDVQFTVEAAGRPSLYYQWYVNGVPFSGATDPTLVFSAARSTDTGDYTVKVSNAVGTVTSLPARLTVTPAAAAESPARRMRHPISPWFYAAALVLILLPLGLARPAARRVPSIFLQSD